MKTHYTEADLLETYYTQPGESMPVMLHLARCSECAARYERLERKIREAAACHPHTSEGFWAAQRNAVMARIGGATRRGRVPAVLRVAAALLLAIAAGVLVVTREAGPPAHAIEALEQRVPADPWQSEELQDFGAVVQWESWSLEADHEQGGQRL